MCPKNIPFLPLNNGNRISIRSLCVTHTIHRQIFIQVVMIKLKLYSSVSKIGYEIKPATKKKPSPIEKLKIDAFRPKNERENSEKNVNEIGDSDSAFVENVWTEEVSPIALFFVYFSTQKFIVTNETNSNCFTSVSSLTTTSVGVPWICKLRKPIQKNIKFRIENSVRRREEDIQLMCWRWFLLDGFYPCRFSVTGHSNDNSIA